MKRYIDFQEESWPDRARAQMQAARWEACLNGISSQAPCAGVIDAYSIDLLTELIDEGWVNVPHAPSNMLLRRAARRQVMGTLKDDADCLSLQEHTLVERMLIGDGRVFLGTVSEFEAAFTLKRRLWCDVGVFQERPCCRLDGALIQALPEILTRACHMERRSRIFVFDGMMHGLLYLSGFLDDRLPKQRFIEEVLQTRHTPETERLARNYLEAAFDCTAVAGCNLLLHEDLAAPESLVGTLASQGGFQLPSVTPNQLAGSMNGILPEELPAHQKLSLALRGALRPELDPEEAAGDLRMLLKQGATLEVLHDVMAGMLCVLPTAHIENALLEMSVRTPRWIAPWSAVGRHFSVRRNVGRLH
ncbi:MAG: hypothetical protein FWF69_06850 [Firmicutes bacterium]|nr:hypothetical protein [Bacillota bacterium]